MSLLKDMHVFFTCIYGFLTCMYVSLVYGVASVSRIDEIIGLFCKRALLKRLFSVQMTCTLIDLTDRSHPIPAYM